MVFNHEVLFLHLGKTGGTSVSWLLCNTLKPPVFNVFEHANLKQARPQGYEFLLEGKRHANLPEAKALLEQYGMETENLKLILIMVRNPVDLELSHYRHLRKDKVIKRARPDASNKLMERVIAAKGSFDDFVRRNLTHYAGELKDFFTIRNQIPDNLRIVRMEEMHKILPDLLRPFQKQAKQLPQRNKSEESVSKKLSQRALQNIYFKYQWMYDHEFYENPLHHSFGPLPSDTEVE